MKDIKVWVIASPATGSRHLQTKYNSHSLQVRQRMESQSRGVAPSYLAWSIFNTLCCCLPLGIAAIVCSCRAQNANALGESAQAEDASRTAKILNVIGLVCGIILIIIFIALKATQH
ncbi:interferon-induced transmembrane protein 2-like [Morone saxatilis]|uniref:interferon-induced transmembrane protein 2-like n=1 Tax=Morone saxatilis TaxID=34816 RepID=UPI0015E2338B|nr:interferon-induced transmembrane protein 2-like [Morone saxatilis]